MIRILLAAVCLTLPRPARSQSLPQAAGQAAAAAARFSQRPAPVPPRAEDPAALIARLRAEGVVALGQDPSGAAELRLQFPQGTVMSELEDGTAAYSFFAVGRLGDGDGSNRERFTVAGLRAAKVTERTPAPDAASGETSVHRTERLELTLAADGAASAAARTVAAEREGAYPAGSAVVPEYTQALWSVFTTRTLAAVRLRAAAEGRRTDAGMTLALDAPSEYGGLRVTVTATDAGDTGVLFEHGSEVSQSRPGDAGEVPLMRSTQRVQSRFSLDVEARLTEGRFSAQDSRWDRLDPSSQGEAYQEILRAFSGAPLK